MIYREGPKGFDLGYWERIQMSLFLKPLIVLTLLIMALEESPRSHKWRHIYIQCVTARPFPITEQPPMNSSHQSLQAPLALLNTLSLPWKSQEGDNDIKTGGRRRINRHQYTTSLSVKEWRLWEQTISLLKIIRHYNKLVGFNLLSNKHTRRTIF
mgnify:CR=1 FL=1